MTAEHRGYDGTASVQADDIVEAFAVYRRTRGDVTVKLVPGHVPNPDFVEVHGLSVDEVAAAIRAYKRVDGKDNEATVDDPPVACTDLAIMSARDLAAREGAMTMAEFQDGCGSTATYPRVGDCPAYPLLGLIGEVGELMAVALRAVDAMLPSEKTYIHCDVMGVAMNVGRIAEILKKAYRNHDGVLDPYARSHIAMIIADAREGLDEIEETIDNWDPDDRVELPPFTLSAAESHAIVREGGDVGWYWAITLSEFRLKLGDVCRALLDKLRTRAERGTLHSTGDDESARKPASG